MTMEHEVQTSMARRLRRYVGQLYSLAAHLTDRELEALDYGVSEIWSAFRIYLTVCEGCRGDVPELLAIQQQGRSYCPECTGKQTGYSTTGSRRRRSAIRYRRPR